MENQQQTSLNELPIELVRQIDSIAWRAERALRQGSPVNVEDFLKEVDRLGQPVLLEELLRLEMEELSRKGQPPTAADLLSRFPTYGDVVQRILAEALATERNHQASASNEASASPPPQRFPNIPGYTIERPLGRGAMGVVYLARHERLQRPVALKVMASGIDHPKALSIIRSEAEVIARLRHLNIVQVYETGEDHGEPFLTMEYIDGHSLKERLQHGLLPIRQTVELIEQLARAIHHAHVHGVIHRDLKPANILLPSNFGELNTLNLDGSSSSVNEAAPKISDFGLAKILDELHDQTRSGAVVGTPKYMSPEQAEGRTREVGPASDIYALGAILYEMLTGNAPFDADSTLQVLKRISHEEAKFSSDMVRKIPIDLQAITLKCLEKSPVRRYASAQELADDLRRYLEDFPVIARRPSRLDLVTKFVRRNRMFAASLAIVIVTLVTSSLGIGIFAIREAQARLRAEKLAFSEADARARREALHVQELKNAYWANLRLAQQALRDGKLEYMQQLLQQAIANEPGDEDLRGFEWHYLWRLSHPPSRVLDGRKDATIAYNHDGALLAVADALGGIRVIETQTGTTMAMLPGESEIMEMVFNPQGTILAVASRDATVRIWDWEQQRQVYLFQQHQHPVRSLAFTHHGTRLISADEVESAIAWNAETGQVIWSITRPFLYVMDLDVNQATNRVVLGLGKGQFAVHDLESGEELACTSAHKIWLSGVAMSPDGQRLVTCGGDRLIRVWDLQSMSELTRITGHEDWVTSVQFNREGSEIASSSRDGSIRLWDAETGQQKSALLGHSNWVMKVVYSPDGEHLASSSSDRSTRIWTPNADWEARTLAHQSSAITCLAFTPNGEHLILGCADGTVSHRHVASGQERNQLRAHPQYISTLSLSRNGTRLATGSHDHTIKIWDAESYTLLQELRGHTNNVRAIAFSPDARYLASTSDDSTTRVWDCASGESLQSLQSSQPGKPQVTVAFSPDGRYLASGGLREIVLWDTSTWKEFRRFTGHEGNVHTVAFSQDGRHLASAGMDQIVRLWDLYQENPIRLLKGHTNLIQHVEFNRDGTRILSCGCDGTAKLWSTDSGRELLTLAYHSDWINAASFNPLENKIATGSNDQTVKLIELD